MLYDYAEQHLQIHNNALLFDKGLGPQVLYSKVGGIVPGWLSKLIIMSFLFLPNGSFNPKYHSFGSVLLSRIVFINAEQDLFFYYLTGTLVLDVGHGLKIKRIHTIIYLCIALLFREYKDRTWKIKW